MKIGFTGHQKLDNQNLWKWVENILAEIIKEYPSPVIGINSLAIGGDQLFAELIIKHSGDLHAVIPFESYESTFNEGSDRNKYLRLLEKAKFVEILPAQSSDEESYFAAGKRVVELSDLMVTLWNGKKAAGLGGTGDVVAYAKSLGKKLVHLNPNTQEVKIIESAK